MRLLYEWHDHGNDRVAASDAESDTRTSQAGTQRQLVPLRYTHAHFRRGDARGKGVRRESWPNLLQFLLFRGVIFSCRVEPWWLVSALAPPSPNLFLRKLLQPPIWASRWIRIRSTASSRFIPIAQS